MANTNYTTLLGLALPVTGELKNQWGDVVNEAVIKPIEEAIAAATTVNVTNGTVILSTSGVGPANQARHAILIIEGSPNAPRKVVAPGRSKTYVVVNTTEERVTIAHGSNEDGADIPAGKSGIAVWDGAGFASVVGGSEFGTGAGTAAEGNDSRILNGQEAFEWGDHGEAGYAKSDDLSTVAFSGSFNDLEDRPEDPSAPPKMTEQEAEEGVSTAQRTIDAKVMAGAIYYHIMAFAQANLRSITALPGTTVSTNNPSGGQNGDIWLKIE